MALTDAFRSLRLPALSRSYSFDDLLGRWHDALISGLPAKLRHLLARRDHRLIVVPVGATARLFQARGGERLVVGELDPQVSGPLQAVLAGTKDGRRRSVVELASEQVLKRSVSFPAQVRDNLAQVLGYEIDRLSPFRSDQVYFDFRIRDDLARGDKLTIELALCRRDQAREWLQRLRDAGAPAELLTWEGAWPKANLLPVSERPSRGSGPFSLNKLLLLLILVLAAAALVTPIWQKQRIHDERAAGIDELKVRAEKVHEMRASLERARQGSVAVLQRKWEQPRMIDLLRELTERLPDDTWVQNLDFRDGEVQVRGESTRATALIKLLDQAAEITEVAFRSPVVQVAGSERERFHISLKYERQEEP